MPSSQRPDLASVYQIGIKYSSKLRLWLLLGYIFLVWIEHNLPNLVSFLIEWFGSSKKDFYLGIYQGTLHGQWDLV